jgi:RNA polymerase sigma factor (sigma-70 family)
MATKSINGVLQHVRALAAVQVGRALTDRELLQRFVEQNDEAAFTVLIERHGPLVLGVCQRALRHSHDAEDACQATFLVFARKAGSIRKTASLGSWLHGVACRIAGNLKRQKARRQKRERQAAAPSAHSLDAAANWQDVETVLDEELQLLPDRYRAPLLLCYWKGKTRDEAAEQLGLSTGKLHGLLERGRTLLRERLSARGLTLSAALCASLLAAGPTNAALAPTLVIASTKAALLLAAGEPLSPHLVSSQVMTLTREVLRSMFFTKLKIATASILCAGLVATFIGGSLAATGSAQNPPAKAKAAEPQVKGENDEAFIRRLSKDLRGSEPTPTEVHFFVTSKDAGKRQKLIDLFIQERQVKQSTDHVRAMLHRITVRTELLQKQIDKNRKADKTADPLEAKRLKLEAELKRIETELRDLKKKEASKGIDKQHRLLEETLEELLVEKQRLDLQKTELTWEKAALQNLFELSLRAQPTVSSLQNTFFRSIIAAGKEKKDMSALTQNYLDSLIKYIQDQPKASDVPDAILQIELVYRALGKTVEANAWAEKLRKQHPNSPPAKNRQSSLDANFRLFLSAAEGNEDEVHGFFLGDRDVNLQHFFSSPLQSEPQKSK